jgi:WD40 repeat protein
MRVIQYPVEKEWADYGFDASVVSLQFRSDGRELAAVLDVGGSYRVAFWDLRENVGRKPIDLGGGFEGAVYPVLSPDFGLVAHIGNEQQGDNGGLHAILSRWSRGKRVDRCLGWWWGECMTAMCFSPDGRRLAVTGWDAHDGFPGEGVAVWDVAAVQRARGSGGDGRHWVGRQAAATLLPANAFMTSLAFSPDGATLAGGAADQGVFRWDLATGRQLPTLPVSAEGGRAWVDRLACSPDGKRLAARDSYHNLLVFDTANAAASVPVRTGAHQDVAFHPASRVLATVALDRTVTFWDAATGTKQQVFTWDVDSLRCVAFSPDGCTCAAGGDNGQVVIWDVEG